MAEDEYPERMSWTGYEPRLAPDRTRYVAVPALARMLGSDWSRSSVWYWLRSAGIEVEYLPGPWGRGTGVVPAAELSEVLFRLRAARAQRRHDGQGGGEARARRLRQGGVY